MTLRDMKEIIRNVIKLTAEGGRTRENQKNA